MKGKDLFLDFGGTPEESSARSSTQPKRQKKQHTSKLKSIETIEQDTPDQNTEGPKSAKRTHVSTPAMKTTPEKKYQQYTPDEIMQSSLEYFHGDELAANVWMNKYALRDGSHIYELNPDMMHRRIASEFARIEKKYSNPLSEEDIYQVLKNFQQKIMLQ